MLITLALLGRLIERRAKERVLESLQGFLSLMPTKVRIVSEAWPEGRFAAAGALSPGDLFRVQSGEIVAADGVVLSGGGAIDESSITGEPLPLARRPGDAIRSGSRVLEGEFTVCAERVGGDSTLGQMAAVVEATLARRPAAEPWTERVLRRVVPAVFALAAAAGAAVAFAGGTAEAAVLRAVTVVVITCPCALGIAIPLTRSAAVALAARRGMIVRRFSALARAPQVDTIVLDKTGTVTRGEWTLLKVVPLGGFSAEKALALASGLEQGVDHPVARLLAAEARERHIRPERVALVQPEPNGVIGLWEGLEARIGSAEFLAEEFAGLRLPSPSGAPGRSQVFLGVGGRPAAVFVFGDELRPTSAEAIAALARRGYGLALVSGDGEEATRAVAGRLGIPRCHGGLLPAGKAEVVAELQRRGRRVAMAGDGVNDASALAQADLSLAVYGGGNLGREVADATLMRADPAQLVEFFDFARAVDRTIRQNLGLALGYNAVAIPLAMSGLVSPLVAAGAMLASSLSVLGNTLRLVRRHTPRR
jgi:heavy metal translocating P-type ATPase